MQYKFALTFTFLSINYCFMQPQYLLSFIFYRSLPFSM